MNLKKYNFFCPFCKEQLNDTGEIELKTVRRSGEVGKIFLAADFGNYTYRKEPDVNFVDGEIVDFLCRCCNVNLEAPQHEGFAQLNMRVDENIEFEVIFSRQAGKRKTYVITEDGIETYQE